MSKLPLQLDKIGVPPIKCQGIKTKLVNFITQNIVWNGEGKWIEPFLGSGVVLFNVQPQHALIADTNKHIINLYQQIQKGFIDENIVKYHLRKEGEALKKGGQDYYLEVRKKFNETNSPLDFLFLNRSCFNGIMRFNSKGGYNVPFGHKPERFAQAYITKITNQIAWIRKVMKGKDWIFQVSDWRQTLKNAQVNDFVYLDPPYIGRNADYYNNWTENDATELATITKNLPCGFALSMWLENKYRKNEHIAQHWQGLEIRSFAHFYHVGASEDLRNEMQEALVLPRKNLNMLPLSNCSENTQSIQFELFK